MSSLNNRSHSLWKLCIYSVTSQCFLGNGVKASCLVYTDCKLKQTRWSGRGCNWNTLWWKWRRFVQCSVTDIVSWRESETQKWHKRKRQTKRKWACKMKNKKKLPFYHPDSVELPSQCSPLSPPSSAARCRSAGQWLARHSYPCTPRVHQSPGSCCPRSLPPGRTCHRISAGAWRGCQSPCSWRRLVLPRQSTCLACGGAVMFQTV